LGLALEPLERPVAAAFDLRGHAGQRDEGTELAAAALELEGGDVVFDAVAVAGKGGCAAQIDRSVGADEPGAGLSQARVRD
jgi:hypothetical protein